MPRNRTFPFCYVCVASMCGVSSTLFSYLRRISDVCVAKIANQRRMCCTYVLPMFHCCGVRLTYLEYWEYFVAFQENLNASTCIYVKVLAINVLSEVIDQMFLTVRGVVQGPFRAMSVSAHDQDEELL